MNMSVDEVAAFLDGEVVGNGNVRITGLNGIREAAEGDLTFLSDKRYARYLATTRASAVLPRMHS